jgi:hypothetical protein
VETPKPQEEQQSADPRQGSLDDLLGPPATKPEALEEKAHDAAEAMGVTLTPDVAKPLTDGPVVVAHHVVEPRVEEPIPILKVMDPGPAVTIPHEVAQQVVEALATAGAAAVLVDEKGAVTVPPDHVIEAALAAAASGASPIKVMNPESLTQPTPDGGTVTVMVGEANAPAYEKPAPKKSKRKTKKSKKRYHPLEKPRRPAPHGLFDLKAKAGRTLGVKCLFCKARLTYKSGRPPVICKKAKCFKALRNAYRRDYAKATA